MRDLPARTTRIAVLAVVALTGACHLSADVPVSLPALAASRAAALDAPPPYATRARETERQLGEGLLPVIARTKAELGLVQRRLDGRLEALPRPFRYATREPFLRSLHQPRLQAYQRAVADLFSGALQAVDDLYERSLAAGEELARGIAADRSPLDAGPTGDPLLDRQLAAFEETLRMTLDRGGLEARGYQQSQARDDLLEAFTSFLTEGADEALGGRLLLYLGGEVDQRPRADVVLRTAPGVSADERGLFQAVRLRIVAGDTIVQDLGWQPRPAGSGLPAVTVEGERYLIAPDLAPAIDQDAEAFEQLHRRRILADMQTAVFDVEGRVLGGVDWRLEYRISGRGDLTWQPANEVPRFNPECAEAAALRDALASSDEG